MSHPPDELRLARYGAPGPGVPLPVTTMAWRTTGYALAVQVGLWVAVTLGGAVVDAVVEAREPEADPTFAGFGIVLGFVGGLAAVGVTALTGFALSWLLETGVRRFAITGRSGVAPVVFAMVGAVVGGGLTLLALRGQLERPGDADPVTRGALVWGFVAGAFPAGAGRWLADHHPARWRRARRADAAVADQTAV
jgi:hypothetical protein